tara:strand:- start:3832 stop:5109 length:1278 start_codon:yes stop_codon:yes gene_type:complete
MATPTRKRTLKQIRQSIGVNLDAINQDNGAIETSVSDSSGNLAVVRDDSLQFGAHDEHRGKWIIATDSGTNRFIRRVQSSDPDARTITVAAPFATEPTADWSFELWDDRFAPTAVHDYVNQSLAEVTRKGSVPVTLDSVHTGGGITEWAAPSSIIGIQDVFVRRSYTGEQLLSFDDALSSVGSNVTIYSDSEDYREGSGSAKLTVGAGAGTSEALAASSFDAVDISGYDKLELFLKTNTTTTATAFTLSLYEGSSAKETITLPAITADIWTYVELSLANAELDTGITSARLNTGASDAGALTLWIDDLKAVRSKSAHYDRLPRKFWRVNQDDRTLWVDEDAGLSYSRLRLTARRAPSLLSNDSDVCEVDSQFVINSTMAKALRSAADRGGGNADASDEAAERREAQAQALRLKIRSPSGIRWFGD